MKTIKIKFVDFWDSFNYENFYIYKILKKNYNVVICDDPDYIFFSDHGYSHLKYDCIRIYCTIENKVPNFNHCDYAIGFHYLTFEDRYLRCPIYLLFNQYRNILKLALTKHNDKSNYMIRDKFCNMVVSNGLTNERNEFFHKLSGYKQVDSGGKILNNVGGPVKSKLEFQKQYKFSLAFENSCSNGYTTEKIIDAFASGGIPIYWGDPKIKEIFNPKSFINANDFENYDELIRHIKKIDNDDKLFLDMVKEPAFINQKYLQEETTKLEEFIIHIFSMSVGEAKRRCPNNIQVIQEKKYYLLSDKIVKIGKPFLRLKSRIKNKRKNK